MGHYDNCREGHCAVCGQTGNLCGHNAMNVEGGEAEVASVISNNASVSKRPSIKTCSKSGLMKLTDELSKGGFDPALMRRKLIFAAGAVNNKKLLAELGSLESSAWYEGRRAVDPDFDNPYWSAPPSRERLVLPR